jgi:hypothetical protein
MENYQGVIIEESLADKAVLGRVKILSTKVKLVTESEKTPWLKQWTMHTVEIPEDQAKAVAELLSTSIDTTHGSWYADFKTETHHYVIYPGKVFFIDRSKKEEYDEATKYGISLGIPDYQVDFSPHVKAWAN